MIKTILAALDGSDHAFKALDFAADLADKYGARLIALNVFDDKPMSEGEKQMAAVEYHAEILTTLTPDALMDVRGDPRVVAGTLVKQYAEAATRMRRAIADRLMSEARARAKAKGVGKIETVVEEGDPASVILDQAKVLGVDTIVMGSRGLGDLKGLLVGSVSHKVSHHAECTCIAVK